MTVPHDVSSEQPEQSTSPWDAVPEIVLHHGLCAVHPWPLVGQRTAGGGFQSWRTSPSLAWQYPYIQLESAGSSIATLTYDCDDLETMANALTWDLPPYNWFVWTEHGAHVTWCLAYPVHRYPEARIEPLRLVRYVAEFYHHALGADPGYAHVLTRNPCPVQDEKERKEKKKHPGTVWGATEPYSLDTLWKAVPASWRPPPVSQTGIGRNCDLFCSLMRWAGHQAHLAIPVLGQARVVNQRFDIPLPETEVAATVKEVEKYRAVWQARGWHRPGWVARQAERGRQGGRRSGESRRHQTADRDSLVTLDHMLHGLSEREIALKRGLPKSTVHNILRRSRKGLK